jgi:hypothetical protein
VFNDKDAFCEIQSFEVENIECEEPDERDFDE